MRAKDERGARSVTRILDNGGTTLGQACDNPRIMDERPQRADARRPVLKGVLGHLERALDAIAGACLAGHLHRCHGYILPGCSSRSSSRRA